MIPVCSLGSSNLAGSDFVFLPADTFFENYIYFTTLSIYYSSLARSCLENCFCGVLLPAGVVQILILRKSVSQLSLKE
jgi:hypothetical protein